MLARLQQAITLGLVLVASAWAAWFAERGQPGWALAGALGIVFGYVAVLGIEFAIAWVVNRDDPAPRARLSQVLRAWLGESTHAPRVFSWRQPFRSHAEPDSLPAHSPRRGVLLVHGFFCNRGLWNPWMRRLRARGIPFVAVSLEPVFGSIDRYVPTLDAAVSRLIAATGQPPVIVAHSMGGLAVRRWLDAMQADDRVHRVVTIGTPHHGTFLGRFSHSTNTRQMRVGGPWLTALASREPASRYRRFTCFHGHADNIVFPASTATLPGADNRHLPACAHVQMAFHSEVFSEVLRWLEPPTSSASQCPSADSAPAR